MRKEDIIYVTAQPDVPYFHWQIELYVHNFISLGINPDKIHVVLSLQGSTPSKNSERLKKLGCHTHFYLYMLLLYFYWSFFYHILYYSYNDLSVSLKSVDCVLRCIYLLVCNLYPV